MSQEPGPLEINALTAFDHYPRTRIVFGVNAVERSGELARELGARKVLLVTDAGIVAAGHAEHVLRSLEAAKVSVSVFDKVHENPGTRDVDACVADAKAAGIDAIFGLGGGSSMDTAKACNFLLTNGGRMQDYWGVGKATKPMLPLVAIPTTAGTGSECQSAALIVDEVTHQKMACLDAKAAARIAILDPALTLSQPSRVTAWTGIDAIAHAIETAVTKKRNALSWMYSREAFKLCVCGFPEVLMNPNDIRARGRMLLGAALAGLAIENSMLGAAHAAANPLTAHYGIVHGEAVGLMLPEVIRFNSRESAVEKTYAELAGAGEIDCGDNGPARGAKNLVERVEALLDLAGAPASLSVRGVERKLIPTLAREAARQWTGSFNPRPISEADFTTMYEAAFEPRKKPVE
jgi:alcohol dehydrogenase